jgi:hypothetical protein
LPIFGSVVEDFVQWLQAQAYTQRSIKAALTVSATVTDPTAKLMLVRLAVESLALVAVAPAVKFIVNAVVDGPVRVKMSPGQSATLPPRPPAPPLPRHRIEGVYLKLAGTKA